MNITTGLGSDAACGSAFTPTHGNLQTQGAGFQGTPKDVHAIHNVHHDRRRRARSAILRWYSSTRPPILGNSRNPTVRRIPSHPKIIAVASAAPSWFGDTVQDAFDG